MFYVVSYLKYFKLSKCCCYLSIGHQYSVILTQTLREQSKLDRQTIIYVSSVDHIVTSYDIQSMLYKVYCLYTDRYNPLMSYKGQDMI